MWESFIAALCVAVSVGLLGCLLGFDAVNIFYFLPRGSLLGVLLRVMEAVKGEEDMVPPMACRAHVGGTWRSKTVRLSACTKDNYITCKFFGMAYKALQDLILDTFSALSADLCRAPSPKHPEVFCGSLNPPCFKCLCSFVHPLLYQECLLLPTCLVASYCFL